MKPYELCGPFAPKVLRDNYFMSKSRKKKVFDMIDLNIEDHLYKDKDLA